MRISDWSSDVCSSDLETGDREGLASIFIFHAEVAMENEDEKEKAVDYAKQSAAIYHELGLSQAEAISLLTVAKPFYRHEDYVPALDYANHALRIAEASAFGNEKRAGLTNIRTEGRRCGTEGGRTCNYS